MNTQSKLPVYISRGRRPGATGNIFYNWRTSTSRNDILSCTFAYFWAMRLAVLESTTHDFRIRKERVFPERGIEELNPAFHWQWCSCRSPHLRVEHRFVIRVGLYIFFFVLAAAIFQGLCWRHFYSRSRQQDEPVEHALHSVEHDFVLTRINRWRLNSSIV